MPRTIITSRLHSNIHNAKNEQEPNKTQSILPQNLQSFKQKVLGGSGYVEDK